MSYYVSAAAIAVGTIGIAYSSQTAEGTDVETEKQKITTGLIMGISIALFAGGMAGIYYNTAPVNQLKWILQRGGENTLVQKCFKAFNETQGISSSNYLPWQEGFLGNTGYIDGIRPDNLKKAAMWGIDPFKRPFIAVKYLCEQAGRVSEGATALFQRYTSKANWTATGGHFEARCLPNLGDALLNHPNHTEFAAKLKNFLNGGSIVENLPFINATSILTLAK